MMFQPLYALFWLICEHFAAHRDAQIRFLRAENAILKSRLGNRVICDPHERALLLKIGSELDHWSSHLQAILGRLIENLPSRCLIETALNR